jgi:hypothetical protein
MIPQLSALYLARDKDSVILHFPNTHDWVSTANCWLVQMHVELVRETQYSGTRVTRQGN